MKQTQVDAEHLARQIGQDLARMPLTAKQQQRLAAARQQALARSSAWSPSRIWAGMGSWGMRHPLGARRLSQAAWLALMLGAGLVWWQMQPESYIDDDIDTQLLADELPVETWLSEQADTLARGNT